MKSVSSSLQRFPLVNWHYRSETLPTLSGSSQETKSPALYKLSGNFVTAELTRDYVAEFAAFALISAISAYPIFLSIVAVVRMTRGY
jgi:hypothetical protein